MNAVSEFQPSHLEHFHAAGRLLGWALRLPAVLLGWWFWGELPDVWVWVGSALIMCSGLAIAYHDRRTTLKRRPTA